jgi:hypothetical protein
MKLRSRSRRPARPDHHRPRLPAHHPAIAAQPGEADIIEHNVDHVRGAGRRLRLARRAPNPAPSHAHPCSPSHGTVWSSEPPTSSRKGSQHRTRPFGCASPARGDNLDEGSGWGTCCRSGCPRGDEPIRKAAPVGQSQAVPDRLCVVLPDRLPGQLDARLAGARGTGADRAAGGGVHPGCPTAPLPTMRPWRSCPGMARPIYSARSSKTPHAFQAPPARQPQGVGRHPG